MNFIALATHYGRITPSKIHVALPLSIMAALYWLSSLPGLPRPEDPALYSVFYWVPPSIQNILHIPAYAILAWSWHWALRAWTRTSSALAIGSCSITSLYGIFDEWHQSFIPGRVASFTDVGLDFAGALVGTWLAVRMIRYVASCSVIADTTRIHK